MCHYNHSLSIDATIIVSKNCPIIGEHVGIIFVTQLVAIATLWPAKNTLNFSFKRWYFKNGTVNFFLLQNDRILISKMRCSVWQSLKNSVHGVQSHLKFSKFSLLSFLKASSSSTFWPSSMPLSVISSFSSVRFEANLEKKLEICWPVRNSELVKRQCPLLSLAVIMDLDTDAGSNTEFTGQVIFLLIWKSCSSNMTRLQGPSHR